MAQRQRLSAEVAIEGLLDPSFTRAFSKMNNGLRGVTDKIDGIGKEQKQLFRQRDEWLKMGKSVDHFDKAIDKSNRSLKTQLRLMDRLHVERFEGVEATARFGGSRDTGRSPARCYRGGSCYRRDR